MMRYGMSVMRKLQAKILPRPNEAVTVRSPNAFICISYLQRKEHGWKWFVCRWLTEESPKYRIRNPSENCLPGRDILKNNLFEISEVLAVFLISLVFSNLICIF